MPTTDPEKAKLFSKGFNESMGADPIVKKIKGLFGNEDDPDQSAMKKAIAKKRVSLGSKVAE